MAKAAAKQALAPKSILNKIDLDQYTSSSKAIQRAHRIGQTKKVTAVRFVMEGTIEERMLQLQATSNLACPPEMEKKQLVFEGTVDGSSEAMSRLTGEDLQFLFKR
eukprot:gene25301-30888_t